MRQPDPPFFIWSSQDGLMMILQFDRMSWLNAGTGSLCCNEHALHLFEEDNCFTPSKKKIKCVQFPVSL